jgi:NADH:ubiquinone oxidoreductase subunit 4 (subunit M)
LITAVLFMMCGVIHHKAGTRDIPVLRGLIQRMPVASFILIVGFMASLGLPGLNGFVSELMVFIGAYEEYALLILIPAIAVAIGAAYYIWTMQRIILGKFNAALGDVKDMSKNELIPVAILVALIIFVGLYPVPLIETINPAAGAIMALYGGGA